MAETHSLALFTEQGENGYQLEFPWFKKHGLVPVPDGHRPTQSRGRSRRQAADPSPSWIRNSRKLDRLRRENARLADALSKAELLIEVKESGCAVGMDLPKTDPEGNPDGLPSGPRTARWHPGCS